MRPFSAHIMIGCLLGVMRWGAGGSGADAPSSAAPNAEGVEFFEKNIRPVLSERCYECHSAAAKKLKGKLRLDTKEDLERGGESGRAVIPGQPEQSLLIKAIRYIDDDLQTPPK